MSQSIKQSSSRAPNALPWNDQQIEQVKGLRKAISNREDPARIDNDVAPLMSELLARVDTITSTLPHHKIAQPIFASASALPSPQQMFQAASSTRGKLADAIQAAPDDGTRQRLVGMLKVLDEHVAMKREILFRVQDASGR